MIDLLRASIEEAEVIRTREDALVFIGGRGPVGTNHSREALIKWTLFVLEENFLPHVSTDEKGHLKKAYFVGYMVNRML